MYDLTAIVPQGATHGRVHLTTKGKEMGTRGKLARWRHLVAQWGKARGEALWVVIIGSHQC